jgi:hypothetical protein
MSAMNSHISGYDWSGTKGSDGHPTSGLKQSESSDSPASLHCFSDPGIFGKISIDRLRLIDALQPKAQPLDP